MTSRAQRSIRADGEATRNRILEAAGELFAATGYAETTSKAIAARANVDLASINYHFRGRSELYQAVLAEAHHRLVSVDGPQEVADSNVPATVKLRALIERFVRDAATEAPGWHQYILARELLAPTSHLAVVFQEVALPKTEGIKRILGEITGIPLSDPALTRCVLSVVAPFLMLSAGGHSFPGSVQEILKMPRQAIVNHLYQFTLGGLEAISREYRKHQTPHLGSRPKP